MPQVGWADLASTVAKEARAGVVMGTILGTLILLVALFWPSVSNAVGLVVALTLPLVSLGANAIGAALTIVAHKIGVDPAITSVPLTTTIVDCGGLMVYFFIAKVVLGFDKAAGAA